MSIQKIPIFLSASGTAPCSIMHEPQSYKPIDRFSLPTWSAPFSSFRVSILLPQNVHLPRTHSKPTTLPPAPGHAPEPFTSGLSLPLAPPRVGLGIFHSNSISLQTSSTLGYIGPVLVLPCLLFWYFFLIIHFLSENQLIVVIFY